MRALCIRDDRGRDMPVHTDDLLRGEPWNAARSSHARGPARPVIFRSGLQRLAVGAQILTALFLFPYLVARRMGIPYLFAVLLVLQGVVVLYYLSVRYFGAAHGRAWRRRLANARSSAAALRQHARLSIARDHACPCCAYGLGDTAPDPDACTTCPECGAAWRVDLWSNDAGIYKPPAVTPEGKGHDRGRLNTVDARGVIVPLLANRPDRARRDALTACIVGHPNVRLRWSLLAWGVVLTLTGLAAWVAAVLVEPQGVAWWGAFAVLILLLGVCIAFPVGAAYFHQLDVATHPYLVREMSGEGTCPCCESRLRDTPSAIDGCLLCDTCGCAWDPPQPAATPQESGDPAPEPRP